MEFSYILLKKVLFTHLSAKATYVGITQRM